MEDSEGPRILSSAVTEEEWGSIPTEVAEKLETFVGAKIEELITSKALMETSRFNTEQELSEIKQRHEEVLLERDQLKARLESATVTISTLESQVSTVTSELTNLQATCQRLETEHAEFRHQRNLAIDEKDEHLKMLQRRNAEVERLQSEVTTLTQQLETAITAKCEALALADEVTSMKLTVEYKEKRMEQEKALLNSQIESLTEDLNQRTEELLNMRRDNTSRCIQLENKLTEKQQELAIASEQIKSLTELNNNLTARIEELSEKLMNQRDMEAKMSESYQNEIEAKTKLANAYNSMYEESQKHSKELEEALSEVQQLLKTATEQYGELETKYKEAQLAHEEILAKKNEYIAMLNKELEKANELLENSKQHELEKDMEGISPTAVTAARLLKSGMSMTELYSQVETLRIEIANKEEENARLNNYITTILREIEEKGPLIKKLRQDYCNLLDANETLKADNDSLLAETQQLREAMQETKRLEAAAQREIERQKKSVSDLSRQVCHLLHEVEQARTASSSTSTDMDLSDSVSSADIISKKLVTFNDISELQSTNQKLLILVRELTERQEEVESMDPAAVAELKQKLDNLRESQEELLEERDRQNKMMETLKSQRDMYKNLYNQVLKASGEDIPGHTSFNGAEANGDITNSKSQNDNDSHSDDKIQELERIISKYKKEIKQLKEDNDLYRKEKSNNEQMLVEQLEKLRSEVKELTKMNCKLVSQVEVSEDKFKIMQNNADIHKKQINALDSQNRLYNETIIKQEQTITYLKDEIMQAQTKLASAEVKLSNLEKENILLRDSESRLVKERESLKREFHSQSLIHSNIELIKATLERSDAEGRLRLESRLDDAHRECATLRRRLQEEQEHFRQLANQLERKTNTAVERMEEEKREADKLRKELSEVRENVKNKSAQIEDLTQKLKMTAIMVPESTSDLHRIRELEQQLADSQAEVESLKSKLKTTKETSEQYFNVAENAEKQVKLLLEQQEKDREETEKLNATIRQLQEKCSELEGELSIRMDDQDMANANVRSKSVQLQEELNVRTMNLNTARQQLENARSENKTLMENLKAVENKYAREVVLHSADLQNLAMMKEDLTKALDEVNELKQARDQALEALENNKASWEKQEQLFQKEKIELEQRFKDMESQNTLLLDQIEALNTQLSILQAQTADQQNKSMDSSFNRSFTEEEAKSSEQLLKIVKYLRQEKDIAISKCDILEAEHTRLKSQLELITKQYEEAKTALDSERQETEVSVVTAAKHAEVIRKVETLNAITDSNRALRQERDTLLKQVDEYKARTAELEKELAPLQEKARELQLKVDSLTVENASIKADCNRWRQRSTVLLEKTNRTSPEDWKKLQNERENLAKQLTIERSTTTKLNDEINNLKQDKAKLEEQLKSLRAQNNSLNEELNRLKEELEPLRSQFPQVTQAFEACQDNNKKLLEENKKYLEENRVLTESLAARDCEITEAKNQIAELKNNLIAIRKIAKKYKTASDEQTKELQALKEKLKQAEQEHSAAEEARKLQPEERNQLEERIQQMEQNHKEQLEQLNQQLVTSTEEIDNFKKEFEALKQTGIDKEERFKTLFKNAKDRIVKLTDENTNLRNELESRKNKQDAAGTSQAEDNNANAEYLSRIEELEKEKQALEAEKQQEKEKYTSCVDMLTQKVNKLQKQLALQQGSKPCTSSGSTEKAATEPPTANIKPMAGHSTNTQTQSVPIQPWRSGGEPPLASIRPMSAQLRTVAVLPTSQGPSAAIVPPQQQVHTTGSSSIEALSSSPTSSHTDYVPATSSASSASSMMGPKQVAVPPTQSTQDNEDEDSNMQTQNSAQQQAVALVLPRVEPPSSGPTQEQGTSSSSSNTVTTSQGSMKRPREADNDSVQTDEENKMQQVPKRTRVQQAGTVSDSGLEVEYQVPTSSQRDHEDDSVVVLDSDDEGGADEGEGADDEPDDPDTEGYDEGMEQDNYEDADCQDVEEDEEGGNEVEVIEDSSEVPNQSERSEQDGSQEEGNEQPQSEAISSGTDGSSSGITISQASTSTSMTVPSLTRTRPVAPLLSRQQQAHLLLPHGLDEGGDDGIVPSTPTLYVPRRSDGFGEAVSSPHVPTGRFTFGDSVGHNSSHSSEVVPEQTLEINNVDDNSTGRSVPSTPLHTSPQESLPNVEEQSSQSGQPDVEIPIIEVSGETDEEQTVEGTSEEVMGPPGIAGTSAGSQQVEESEEMLEGDDEVSSEGEKPPTTEENVEEGREAEASPSTNTRSRNFRGSQTSRRPMRQMGMRQVYPRQGPNPIVWSDQRNRQDPQRGRPNTSFSPRANRRGQRARAPRPYQRY